MNYFYDIIYWKSYFQELLESNIKNSFFTTKVQYNETELRRNPIWYLSKFLHNAEDIANRLSVWIDDFFEYSWKNILKGKKLWFGYNQAKALLYCIGCINEKRSVSFKPYQYIFGLPWVFFDSRRNIWQKMQERTIKRNKRIDEIWWYDVIIPYFITFHKKIGTWCTLDNIHMAIKDFQEKIHKVMWREWAHHRWLEMHSWEWEHIHDIVAIKLKNENLLNDLLHYMRTTHPEVDIDVRRVTNKKKKKWELLSHKAKRKIMKDMLLYIYKPIKKKRGEDCYISFEEQEMNQKAFKESSMSRRNSSSRKKIMTPERCLINKLDAINIKSNNNHWEHRGILDNIKKEKELEHIKYKYKWVFGFFYAIVHVFKMIFVSLFPGFLRPPK